MKANEVESYIEDQFDEMLKNCPELILYFTLHELLSNSDQTKMQVILDKPERLM